MVSLVYRRAAERSLIEITKTQTPQNITSLVGRSWQEFRRICKLFFKHKTQNNNSSKKIYENWLNISMYESRRKQSVEVNENKQTYEQILSYHV